MIHNILKNKLSYKDIIVIIPIYKSTPTAEEYASYERCLTILHKYTIYIVTHQEVKLQAYTSNASTKIRTLNFDKKFFNSVDAYSELLRNYFFYSSFKKYKYILIYQLDAWVFKDELLKWCNKGYDYIGAPWFEDYGSYEKGNRLWRVGNGGLSLRKVKKFMELTYPKKKIKTFREILKEEYNGIKSLPICVARAFGYRNTIGYFQNYYNSKKLAEDVYFLIEMQQYENMKLYVPSPVDACAFAFERSPRYLYEQNANILPFGCHAWEKYDKAFWLNHIHIQEKS